MECAPVVITPYVYLVENVGFFALTILSIVFVSRFLLRHAMWK